MNIAKAIKTRRRQLRYTKELLSKECGVTSATLCRIESGHSTSTETLESICKVLQLEIILKPIESNERY